MAKYKMSDLAKRGREHEDEGFGDRWDPPAGAKLPVKVKKVITDENDDGTPRWGVICTVTRGEHKGKDFFINIRFSLEWDFINKQAVDTLEGFGLSADFLDGDPSPEVVAAALEGKSAIVVAKYRKNKKTGKEYSQHTVSPAKTKAPPKPEPEPEPEDDDDYEDDDDDFEDED